MANNWKKKFPDINVISLDCTTEACWLGGVVGNGASLREPSGSQLPEFLLDPHSLSLKLARESQFREKLIV